MRKGYKMSEKTKKQISNSLNVILNFTKNMEGITTQKNN